MPGRLSVQRLLAATVLLAAANSASAVIIGGEVTGGTALSLDGGTFIELGLPFTPPNGDPNSVGNNTFQTSNLYGFNEDQNILLADALSVNLLAGTGSSGSIAAGTTVASHYVFFDPGPSRSQTGYVDFDADILAIITSTGLLAASDFLINNNVTYLNPGARGLEGGDSATIDPSQGNRLLVDWFASTPGDFIRVLTAESVGGEDPCATNPPGVGGCPDDDGGNDDDPMAVPEPGSLSLIAIALLGLGLIAIALLGLGLLSSTRRQG